MIKNERKKERDKRKKERREKDKKERMNEKSQGSVAHLITYPLLVPDIQAGLLSQI